MFPRRRSTAAAACALTALFLCGCSSSRTPEPEAPTPTAVGTLGPGFVDPGSPPTPEATIVPVQGSWEGVHPWAGYQVALLVVGDDRATRTLTDAVTTWAEGENAALETTRAQPEDDLVALVTQVAGTRPDLVIGVGGELTEPLTLVTPSNLEQEFLVLGGELAEPTENVTSVTWDGAPGRGETPSQSAAFDASSFTTERGTDAVRAGVASVVSGLTGIVVKLP